MSQDSEIKVIVKTKAGTRVKVPATLRYDGDRIWFVKSPFALKDEIKSMKGARWHGYEKPSKKMWSVANCARNLFQLACLMGKNPYTNWDQPLKHFEYDRPLRAHQELMSNHMLTYHYAIIAAVMGCVDGGALVKVSRPSTTGGASGGDAYEMPLRDLYKRFTGQRVTPTGRMWDTTKKTTIYALRGDSLGLVKIVNVLSKGVKPVVRITLTDGRSIAVTEDHELYTGWATKKEARYLVVGDKVVVTAAGGSLDKLPLVEKTPSAWDGVKKTKLGDTAFLDSSGYITVRGISPDHPRAFISGDCLCVREHNLVMEELTGEPVPVGMVAHHLNGVKHDNHIENLSLLKDCDHRKLHGPACTRRRSDRVHWQPCYGVVADVTDCGETDVYDIVCDHPYHNFVVNDFVVSNCGKTLSAIELMEKSGHKDWWWAGPKSALKAVEREFHKWGLSSEIKLELMTYDKLRSVMKGWKDGDIPPPGLILDESSRLKSPHAQRTTAAQNLADSIRATWGSDGFVIEMSGTPSPKSPVDWWAQAEIACPGFLREGSAKAFEFRLGIFAEKETMQGKHYQRITWLDDAAKCNVCGQLDDDERHIVECMHEDYHDFAPSKNEVEYLAERLKGLTLVLQEDVLDLPEKQYRTIFLKPSATITRVAKALMKVAPSVITGLTWLRELSDGFQYQDKEDGVTKCPVCEDGKTNVWVDPEDETRTFEMIDMLDADYVATLEKRRVACPRCGGTKEIPKIVRTAKEVPCPKDDAIRQLLEENEEQGRLVIFAGFKGSIDRVTALCLQQKWAVVRVDGRGWKVFDLDGKPIHQQDPLDYWADLSDNTRVAFVAHPQSGGLGLTLTESRMAVFYSNDYNPESRTQAEGRIHRMGTNVNKGATIVDLIHLPTDEKVRDVLQDNRRLELLTLGDVSQALGDSDG